MKRGAWLAAAAFALTWIPLTLWKGIAFGRTFRIGATDQDALGPLFEGVIQIGAAMLAPALFAALCVFVLHSYVMERRAR